MVSRIVIPREEISHQIKSTAILRSVREDRYELISGTRPRKKAGLKEYKAFSRQIRRETAEIAASASRAGSFDRQGKYPVSQYRQSHPAFFIDKRGDLVLVPKAWYESLLQKAQGSRSLRELVPGRFRTKY